MKRIPYSFLLLFLAALLLGVACHSQYNLVKRDYEQTTMNSYVAEDTLVSKMIRPYKDSLDKVMQQTIVYTRVTLKKEQPEGSLCNWVCDALMEQCSDLKPDLCVLNYGGLRIPQISEGAISRGKLFELMPFDNLIVVLYIPGNKLQELLNLTAVKKGWPVAGLQMQLENDKAVNVFIKGEAINPAKTYRLLTNDYIANGGDNCAMLTKVPRENSNRLIRDVLIAYCEALGKKGEKIAASKDGRVY